MAKRAAPIDRVVSYDAVLTRLHALGANRKILPKLVNEYSESYGLSRIDVLAGIEDAARAGVDISEILTITDIDNAIFYRNALILSQAKKQFVRDIEETAPFKLFARFIDWLNDFIRK